MTISSSGDTIVVSTPPVSGAEHSYVDWPAIIGGIVLATAISLVLLAFGSAVGLSFTNFRGGTGVSPIWVAIAAASWLLWVQISSFMAGGYLTGRMRRRAGDATEHEVDVRDGAHGLLVWGGATILGAMIAVSGVGAAVQAIGNAAGSATAAISSVAGGAAGKVAADPNAYFVDAFFRPAAPAAGAAAPASAPAPVATTPADREEISRILLNAATGTVSDGDKAYIATLVSRDTGLPAADAKTRVDTVFSQIDAAKQKLADVAETARRAGVLAAFLTAASLLVSALGAYWAASMGGRHRDEGTEFVQVFRRY